MKIRVLDIAYETMADGPGLRTSIYCAGCVHHCPGCHNPQSWDFMGGREMSVQELLDIIKDDEFANVTFSGGDPLYQVEAFTELARRIKEETDKTIWCYTGFKYEECPTSFITIPISSVSTCVKLFGLFFFSLINILS